MNGREEVGGVSLASSRECQLPLFDVLTGVGGILSHHFLFQWENNTPCRKKRQRQQQGRSRNRERMILGCWVFHLEDTSGHMLQWSRSAICADVADVLLCLFALQGQGTHMWVFQMTDNGFFLVTKKCIKVGITGLWCSFETWCISGERYKLWRNHNAWEMFICKCITPLIKCRLSEYWVTYTLCRLMMFFCPDGKKNTISPRLINV